MSFSAYHGYRDSRVKWLGLMPEHWQVLSLKHLFAVVGGSTPGPDEALWGGDIVWVTPSDLSKRNGLTILTSERRITASGLASCSSTLVPAGTVVLSTRAPIGSLAIAGTELCTNQGCKALVPRPGTRNRFYAYLLGCVTDELQIRGKGTTFLELSAESLGALEVPYPSEAEQETISAFLDIETAKVDALIEEQRRLVELLTEKRQAITSHLVTKGLDVNASLRSSGITWVGEVPEHWKETRLRALFRPVKRQNEAEKAVLSVYRDYGVILKTSREDNGNKTPDDLSKYQLVEPDDLVINKMKAWQGSLGISALEGITSPDYVVFKPRHAECSEFIHLLLRSQRMVSIYRHISNGIRPAQWRLEPDAFLNLTVFLPPLFEQQQIMSFIASSETQIGTLATEALQAIQLLQERRSALIFAAVTGKIDVRDHVPRETAASEEVYELA